ncbi:MAG: cytochrome C [Epsilonproteobacteria bacterium]|nr:cytochrome C [Campylobacterota bacterium]
MKKIVLASIVALAASTALMATVNTAACAACHGKNFEKHALGKSRIVANLTHDEIEDALKGYKVGKGGSMKSIMKGQIGKYSDAEIEAFSKTIGKK